MNKVKYYRLISGLLLKDLSEKTGLSVGHLSHIENGNKQPSKQRLRSTNVVERKPETSVLFTAVQNTPYRKPLRKWGFVRAFQSVRRS